jgi:tRNA threonylcarbamoyladenosine modification (KEOPS) complex  Pcc1 subunit
MDDVPCTAALVLEFSSEREASRVARALEPDNGGFVATRVRGKRIEARIEAQSIEAMLHTLDDYLACLGIAEGMKSKGD